LLAIATGFSLISKDDLTTCQNSSTFTMHYTLSANQTIIRRRYYLAGISIYQEHT
jgi:hypothetical protein